MSKLRYFLMIISILTVCLSYNVNAVETAKKINKPKKSSLGTPLKTNVSKSKNKALSADNKHKSVANKPVKQQKIKAVTINFPIDRQKEFKADINHYLKNANISPMLYGSEDFITLVANQTTNNAKGVAIILPNWQQNVTSPQASNFLRTVLPSYGWTTITIQSPTKPKNYPSTQLNHIARNTANEVAITAYEKKLTAIMTKVMSKAHNYPGIFMVIAQGANAALLTDLYDKNKIEQPSVFIVLSGYLPTRIGNVKYATSLAAIKTPVLDLYLTKDNDRVIGNAPLRLIESKKQLKIYYRQKQLTNFNAGYYPKEDLIRSINSWLKHIGW